MRRLRVGSVAGQNLPVKPLRLRKLPRLKQTGGRSERPGERLLGRGGLRDLPGRRTAAVLVFPAAAAGTGLVAPYRHLNEARSVFAPRGVYPASAALPSISSMVITHLRQCDMLPDCSSCPAVVVRALPREPPVCSGWDL